MNVKSSNAKGDMLIVSCGNEDDPHIKIWSLKEQSSISKYNPNQFIEGRRPYYYMNVFFLNVPDGAELDPDIAENFDESDPVGKGFIIVAASIKHVDAFFKNPMSNEWSVNSIESLEDIGSYLSSMTTVKHDDYHFTCLVSNVTGTIQMYSIKFDKRDF